MSPNPRQHFTRNHTHDQLHKDRKDKQLLRLVKRKMDASLAQALQSSLEKAIQSRFGSDEMALAEYIVVMMQNGKDAPAVTAELTDLMASYDASFTDFIFSEAARLSAPSAPAVAAAPAVEETKDAEMQEAKKGGETSKVGMGYPEKRAYANVRQTLEQNSQERPRGRPEADGVRQSPYGTHSIGSRGDQAGRSGQGAGPIRTARRSTAPAQPAMPLDMTSMLPAGFPMPPPEFFAQFAQMASQQHETRRQDNFRKSRCQAWPECPRGETCTFAHPTMMCIRPNCKREPGFCTAIHDDEPAAKVLEECVQKQAQFEKDAAANRARHQHRHHGAGGAKPWPKPPKQLDDGSTPICRFGEACTNRACGYTHPSPASKDGSSIVLDSAWCEAGKDCKDAQCGKGHPSPSLNYMQQDAGAVACKFTPCLNPNCRFSHAPGQKGAAAPAKALGNGAYGNKVWTPNAGSNTASNATAERSFVAGEATEQLTVPKDTEMTL